MHGKTLRSLLVPVMAGVFLAMSVPAASAVRATNPAVSSTTPPGSVNSAATPVFKWFGKEIAGLLAKDSGKTVTQVESMKTKGENWSAVAQVLGVNAGTFKSQLFELRRQVFRNRLRSRAIVVVLSKQSGKTPKDVRSLKKGKTWQGVASALGLNWQNLQPSFKKEVKDEENVIANSRFLAHFLAKKSNKTVKDIMALKKQDKTWQAVATSLGVTKQELAQALGAHHLSEAKGTVTDQIFTDVLAKASGKTGKEIHTLKLQDGKWKDVVQSLGLDWTSITKEARQLITARDTSQLKINFLVSFLAKSTGKTPGEIRAMKTKSNTWVQVGQALGL